MTKRQIYRTMQGKEIDMAALAAKNETMPAVGNVRMNARGDELGPGGSIIRKREDIVNTHYSPPPAKSVRSSDNSAPTSDNVVEENQTSRRRKDTNNKEKTNEN